jgi:hypothetical protein
MATLSSPNNSSPNIHPVLHDCSTYPLAKPWFHRSHGASHKTFLFFDTEMVENFEFQSGQLPFSTLKEIILTALAYLITLWALKYWVKVRGKPFNLDKFCVYYNYSLSLMSFMGVALVSAELWRLFSNYPVWEVICDYDCKLGRGRHIFFYYCIYFTKYLELTDTFLLCLRAKPTPFIHVYHHAITIFFAWLHLNAKTCIAWFMTTLNLAVHVFLYYYFGLHEQNCIHYKARKAQNPENFKAKRREIWWKKYLTALQVTQFYLTFLPSFLVLIPRVLWTFDPSGSYSWPCAGSWSATWIGIAVLSSYLVLFQSLYTEKYSKTKEEKTQIKQDGQEDSQAGGEHIMDPQKMWYSRALLIFTNFLDSSSTLAC